MIDPSRHNCVGLGIIRSIDPSSGKFFIITSVPQDILSHVNLIIRGSNYDLPSCIYMSGFEVNNFFFIIYLINHIYIYVIYFFYYFFIFIFLFL